MMKLTDEQQLRLTKAAAHGHEFYDSLIVAGVLSADAEELMKDSKLHSLFHKGRTEGAERIREQLMKAAMNGNVSAMKVLALHEPADEDLPVSRHTDGLSDEQRQARDTARYVDLLRRMDTHKQLFQRCFDELNARG
jgi:hypothetical protein